MKKEVSISLAGVLILILGVAAWYNAPNDLMNLDPKEVMEIVVFNGNSGNGTHIEDKGQFQYSNDDLNDIEVKRTTPPLLAIQDMVLR